MPYAKRPNLEPWVVVPQVTTPSGGSATQIPPPPTQLVRFAASTTCSWVIELVLPLADHSITSSGGSSYASVTGQGPGVVALFGAAPAESASGVQPATTTQTRSTAARLMSGRPPRALPPASNLVPGG